ncbi:MAG: nucleoside-diphosphate kinase [Brevinematales bacterium]|nr:nucleoside-diphosphate kinase [Brevinematales bacterium]
MALERTFAMIKPDACKAGHIGHIISMIEKEGFTIIHLQMLKLTEKSVRMFYMEHVEKPFFPSLLEFTLSGKVVAMVLEKENAIEDFRKLMGATDPKKATKGTIRHTYGTEMPANAIHGSDSRESAKREITLFFGEFASIPSTEKRNAKEY